MREQGAYDGASSKSRFGGDDAPTHAALYEARHKADGCDLVWLERGAVVAQHADNGLQREALKRALQLIWLLQPYDSVTMSAPTPPREPHSRPVP